MKLSTILSVSVVALTLTACNKQPGTSSGPQAAARPQVNPAANKSTEGHGTGTVTAIDPKGGQVSLDHGAIPEVGWPAMTMSFGADPAILSTIAVGDKVAFDMTTANGTPKVTAIRHQ
jgi:Cu(I)/Ag(I) efflux system periplasmic protein CusF